MSSETSATIARPDTAEDVLQMVLDIIQELGLKVGEQLPSIRELAERLEVKPTAVRDALLRAQTMGLVRVLPRAGAFLRSSLGATGLGAPAPIEGLGGVFAPASSPAVPNLFHLLDARRLVEVELAGRAAERRCLEDLLPVRRALEAMANILPEGKQSEAKHRADYVEHDVRFHVEISRIAGNGVLLQFQQTLLEQLRPHLAALPWTPKRQHRTDTSHMAIYAALVAGNTARIRAEMCDHLSMAYNSLLDDVQNPPSVKPQPLLPPADEECGPSKGELA